MKLFSVIGYRQDTLKEFVHFWQALDYLWMLLHHHPSTWFTLKDIEK